jgi:hypothetical protein
MSGQNGSLTSQIQFDVHVDQPQILIVQLGYVLAVTM